jgi:hypothetical protein
MAVKVARSLAVEDVCGAAGAVASPADGAAPTGAAVPSAVDGLAGAVGPPPPPPEAPAAPVSRGLLNGSGNKLLAEANSASGLVVGARGVAVLARAASAGRLAPADAIVCAVSAASWFWLAGSGKVAVKSGGGADVPAVAPALGSAASAAGSGVMAGGLALTPRTARSAWGGEVGTPKAESTSPPSASPG